MTPPASTRGAAAGRSRTSGVSTAATPAEASTPSAPSAPAATSATAATSVAVSVFSGLRTVQTPELPLPEGLVFDERLKMDGRKLLARLPEGRIAAAFLDPQYRGVLDRQKYGNEGARQKARVAVPQMTEEIIRALVAGIDRALAASGHLFLWMDKFHLCTGFGSWTEGTALQVVDLVTWNKKRIGMGYRTRRASEYLVVLQKAPVRAKGVWTRHDIPDVWEEKVPAGGVHPKPVGLQSRLIEAVTAEGDVVLDPAAGSFSVLAACRDTGRRFLGCDLRG